MERMVGSDLASSQTREQEIGHAGTCSSLSTCVNWTSETILDFLPITFYHARTLSFGDWIHLMLDRLLMVWSNGGIRNCAVSTMDLSVQ